MWRKNLVWTIKFDKRALKELKKVDKKVQKDIVNYCRSRLETDKNPRRFGKELKGGFKGLWRYRVSDYRVVCQIEDKTLTILVLRVAHRRHIYV